MVGIRPRGGVPDNPDDEMQRDVIYTVGHSTRSLAELIAVLEAAGVRRLVDVRSVPGSRRHPQFSRESLASALPAQAGVEYQHEPELGGFRRPRPDSRNGGWRQQAFRGYADHMQDESFVGALARLEARARELPSCVMCAEAQWWRCHRRLIADALVARGWSVQHLGLGGGPVEHELTPFGVVGPDASVSYPPPQAALDLAR